jgi:hypothetical protein
MEEEGAFSLHFQGESRCDLENLNIAWFVSAFKPWRVLVLIVRLVVTEYCYKLNHRCCQEMDDCGNLIQG